MFYYHGRLAFGGGGGGAGGPGSTLNPVWVISLTKLYKNKIFCLRHIYNKLDSYICFFISSFKSDFNNGLFRAVGVNCHCHQKLSLFDKTLQLNSKMEENKKAMERKLKTNLDFADVQTNISSF